MRLYALFFIPERKIRRSAEDTKVHCSLYGICSFMRLHEFSVEFLLYRILSKYSSHYVFSCWCTERCVFWWLYPIGYYYFIVYIYRILTPSIGFE